jgi:ABC-type transporter Mla maintaining outer membrane lipid asymmetry permease subunit MlaE
MAVDELRAMGRAWLASTGEIGKFTGNIVRDVYGLRVFRFFGETLRQAGVLIVGSTAIIWTLMFILGLQCGIEGAYSPPRRARRRTPACSPPGVTCARSLPTPSAT